MRFFTSNTTSLRSFSSSHYKMSTETYKLLPIFTGDGYKLKDVFQYTVDTDAVTKAELAEYILETWKAEEHCYQGLLAWFQERPALLSLVSKDGDCAGLTPAQVETACAAIRTQLAKEGTESFIQSVQAHPLNPIFFLKRSEPNPLLVDFLVRLAKNC